MTDLSSVWATFTQGDYATAMAVAQRVLHDQPGHIEALSLLGAAAFAGEDFSVATRAYQNLATLEPALALHRVNLGTAQRAAADLAAASKSYQAAAACGADDASFHLNYGLLLWDLHQIDAAHTELELAYAMAPDDAEIALAFGGLCCRTVRQEQALAVLTTWQQWQSLAETQLTELSQLFLQLGEMRAAETVLKLALTLDPENGSSRVRYAGLLERLNRLDDAQTALAAVLPEPGDATLAFEQRALAARLAQRQGRHAEAAENYQALLKLPQAQDDEQELCYSLAKSLDALRLYKQAMSALHQAHTAQVAELKLYTPKAAAQVEPLRIADYRSDASDYSRWAEQPGDALRPDPLFVVAFPRSGTTLLEQMLDAHPGLCAMDEQPFLQHAVSDMQAHGASYPEQLADLTAAQLDDVRAAYWARVATKVELKSGVRLVDKNPLNMLRLAAIRRLFPNARVLMMVRHPCDVLLSCYMQNFRAPEFALLCQSLPSLAAGYAKAFDFWYAQQAILNTAVLELRYETLVADVAGSARAICDFAQLPWDDRMLDPARHAQQRGYISTPSYSQVVKPVNRDAVGRWQRYAAEFAPVLPILQAQLTRWAYET